MNAQQLKNAILQEAIEGRLVPQDPNDEPASVLLARIRKEKEQLVKEGKLKKKDLEVKPISEDEIPFEIPESWEWCRLRDVLSVKSGEFLNVRSLNEELNYPVYGGNGINGTYNKYNVESDTLIIGRVGFYCGSIHKTFSKAWVTDNALIVTFANNNLYVDYLQYVLRWLNIRTTSNSTAQPVVSGKGIYPLLFPLPPLAEQHRIVAKIEELLPKVEEYGKAQDELNKLNEELPERLKKSILQEAIEGRLVPQDPNDEPASVLLNKIRQEKAQLVKAGKLKKKDLIETPIADDEIPFELPESWEWARLGDVVEFVNGRAYKKDELLDKGKYKVLRVGNFFTNDSWYYSDLELPEDKYCYRGDLLYAWSASFGPKIWDGEKTIFHYHIWNVKYSSTILWREYLYYFFLADKQRIKQSTTGSTMIHVSMENMKPRLIPIPPLAEQKRIVTKIEDLLKEIDKL